MLHFGNGHWLICLVFEMNDALAVEVVSGSTDKKGKRASSRICNGLLSGIERKRLIGE